VALQQGEDEVARARDHLRHTRQVLVDGLTALPGTIVPDAGGAMYVFFRIEGQGDSIALAKRLVAEAGLGLAPGAAFGPEGEGWLRWCHAVAEPRLVEGIDRLSAFLSRQ
jgi:aspartate/methionine/tyrosine aminotransferase